MTVQANEKSGCLALISRIFGRKDSSSSHAADYRVRDDFLSAAEISFYHVLRDITKDRAALFSKVRLADILYAPAKDRSAYNRISQRHVDFLVCDSRSLQPLFAVELDDSSHNRGSRQERDAFVNDAFASANLPLLRIPVRMSYNTSEIGTQIAPYFQIPQMNSSPRNETPPEVGGTPVCSKCGGQMVVRTAKQGQYQGRQFWACSNYPRCRNMLPVGG